MTFPSVRSTSPSTPPPLNLATKLAYGAGDAGPAITANVLVFFLLYFLTDVAGLSPGLAGWVLAIGKISDAINDPIIGVLSDRTRSRWGRRFPWMVAGAIPFGILFWLQWVVPTQDGWWLFVYYVVIGIGFNLAYTAVNLPYTALTPQLTEDYHERTNLNSFRFVFSIGGSILSLLLAQAIFAMVADRGDRYLWLGGLCAVLSVLPIFWCVAGTFRRVMFFERRLEAAQGVEPGEPEPVDLHPSSPGLGGMLQQVKSLSQEIRQVLASRPFQLVIGIYLCSWLAVQLTASILPYFVASYMKLPEDEFPKVALAVQGTALVALIGWSQVSRRLGKQGVFFAGTALWIIAQVGLLLLQPGQVGLMYGLAVLAGFGVAVAYLVPWSMLPDVIDLDELETGQRREGVFYAFMVLLQKIGLAIALWLVGQGIGWAGYVPPTPGQPSPLQPDSALWAIRLSIGPLPCLALVLGIALTWLYPISQTVHSEILLKLADRKQRPES